MPRYHSRLAFRNIDHKSYSARKSRHSSVSVTETNAGQRRFMRRNISVARAQAIGLLYVPSILPAKLYLTTATLMKVRLGKRSTKTRGSSNQAAGQRQSKDRLEVDDGSDTEVCRHTSYWQHQIRCTPHPPWVCSILARSPTDLLVLLRSRGHMP